MCAIIPAPTPQRVKFEAGNVTWAAHKGLIIWVGQLWPCLEVFVQGSQGFRRTGFGFVCWAGACFRRNSFRKLLADVRSEFGVCKLCLQTPLASSDISATKPRVKLENEIHFQPLPKPEVNWSTPIAWSLAEGWAPRAS